jgi:hypothetical protein
MLGCGGMRTPRLSQRRVSPTPERGSQSPADCRLRVGLSRSVGRIAALAGLCTLTACAHVPPAPMPVCLPIKTYTLTEQQALAAALEPLPVDSALVMAMIDYGQLRASARACAAH